MLKTKTIELHFVNLTKRNNSKPSQEATKLAPSVLSMLITFLHEVMWVTSSLNACRLAPKLLLSPQWPNGLASQETQVENLGLLATPVGQALRALALT